MCTITIISTYILVEYSLCRELLVSMAQPGLRATLMRCWRRCKQNTKACGHACRWSMVWTRCCSTTLQTAGWPTKSPLRCPDRPLCECVCNELRYADTCCICKPGLLPCTVLLTRGHNFGRCCCNYREMQAYAVLSITAAECVCVGHAAERCAHNQDLCYCSAVSGAVNLQGCQRGACRRSSRHRDRAPAQPIQLQ